MTSSLRLAAAAALAVAVAVPATADAHVIDLKKAGKRVEAKLKHKFPGGRKYSATCLPNLGGFSQSDHRHKVKCGWTYDRGHGSKKVGCGGKAWVRFKSKASNKLKVYKLTAPFNVRGCAARATHLIKDLKAQKVMLKLVKQAYPGARNYDTVGCARADEKYIKHKFHSHSSKCHWSLQSANGSICSGKGRVRFKPTRTRHYKATITTRHCA